MLTRAQHHHFAEHGFLLLPGLVPEHLLAAADQEVDALLAADPPPVGTVGPHFWFLPPGQLPAADATLRKSDALAHAESLVTPHHLTHGLDHIQVALNIPPRAHRPGGPHIDGHRAAQAHPHTFSMLLAVFLGDEHSVDSGNLWVWPGSHLVHQQLFKARGVNALLPVDGHITLLADPPDIGTPVPILANRGDVLIAHYLLGHNSGGNLTERTRRALYFRMRCHDHAARWDATLLDAFKEYAPVRDAANSHDR